MWLREVPISKLDGTRVSFQGREGIIVSHYTDLNGLIVNIDLAGNSTPADFLYDYAKDQFEVLVGDQLPDTIPAPKLEKKCKNKGCQNMNDIDAVKCWWCLVDSPTDY